jgi:hypothetical protein
MRIGIGKFLAKINTKMMAIPVYLALPRPYTWDAGEPFAGATVPCWSTTPPLTQLTRVLMSQASTDDAIPLADVNGGRDAVPRR